MKKKARRSATKVADARGRLYHIDCAPGDLAPYLLFLGDPGRVDRVAARLDRVERERSHREFR
ncbi:MAG: uridine phosphorylase, partial [Planctomycetes bacterium]|nr:uridine phosphorylase [Planctomycetota bacterium]